MGFTKNNYLRNYKSLILCFIIIFWVYNNRFYERLKYNNNYFKNENFTEAIRAGQIFINKSLNNIITKYDEKFHLLINPKISVVIPLYNQEKNIGRTINTIKNQNMKNIEIIIVNDKSLDNSLKVIKIYQKYDKRIKVINNKNNMGILYSRCIGALSARGKYIILVK